MRAADATAGFAVRILRRTIQVAGSGRQSEVAAHRSLAGLATTGPAPAPTLGVGVPINRWCRPNAYREPRLRGRSHYGAAKARHDNVHSLPSSGDTIPDIGWRGDNATVLSVRAWAD